MNLAWGDWIETYEPDIDNTQNELVYIQKRLTNAINNGATINKIKRIIAGFYYIYIGHTKPELMLKANLNYENFFMKQPGLYPFSQKLKESEQFETNQLNIHDSTAKIVIECLAKQLEKHDAPLAEFMKSNAHFDIAAGRN